jgi:predicted RNA binding protein YcfA (HicA-like mRNA interferase family)
MSGVYPPLTCKQVKSILTNLNFVPRSQKGTSHEHWVKRENGRFYKVTVDCPKAPFSQDLISSMAKQAGVSKKEFYSKLV